MSRARPLGAVLLAAAFLVLPRSAASSGVAIDPQGKPLEDVRVCYVAGEVEQLCVETDARGLWKLPKSRIETVRLSLDGYVPRKVSALDQAEPVILHPAAVLVIRFEGSGRAIDVDGEADLLRPSGKKTGPFPILAGRDTRIRSLEPGPIVVTGRVEGFAEANSPEVELIGGKETVVTLTLSPQP